MTIAVSLHRITIRKRTTMPFNHTATRKRTGCVKMCVSGSSLVSGSSSSLRVPSFQKAKAVKNHASPIRACDVCSLTFTKPYQFDEHMSGKRHAENLKKWLSPGQLLEEFTLSAPHWVTGVTADMLAPLWDKEELSSLGLKSRFSTLHPSQMVSQLSPYQKARMWRYLRDRMGVNHYTEVATILAAVDAHKDGHLRVKEVIESFETYAVLANFIVASRRTQAASDQVSRSLSLSLSLRFKGLFLCTDGVLFHVGWCIIQLACPSAILYNITNIAHDQYTNICSQTYIYTRPPL